MPSPVWPLPICLDSWTWHSMFLCNIALYSIRPCFYHQSHPQLGIVFALAPIPSFFLELFLHWSPVAYWTPTDLGVPLSVSCHFAFSYCSCSSLGKKTEVAGHSLLQWTTFCQTSPPWPVRLGWPHTARHTFIELDKAVVHVIRLASFLWLWFQCVCPLMPSHNTYWLTLVSLTLDVGYLLRAAPAKCSRCSLPWTRGISLQLPLLTLNVE